MCFAGRGVLVFAILLAAACLYAIARFARGVPAEDDLAEISAAVRASGAGSGLASPPLA